MRVGLYANVYGRSMPNERYHVFPVLLYQLLISATSCVLFLSLMPTLLLFTPKAFSFQPLSDAASHFVCKHSGFI